ncbi:MAG: hypothetical protein EB829_04420 [Nitrosopumilus sp. H8]|nr:MAG: hypothetical protein EB829_04420 [Nitrosopumilus sp. H8]
MIDLQDPGRIKGGPDDTRVLLSGSFVHDGLCVSQVELRLYKERTDKKLGLFSLITSYVETDSGPIEMLYDEGFRGESALEDAAVFVAENLGVSGLVLRSAIALRERG